MEAFWYFVPSRGSYKATICLPLILFDLFSGNFLSSPRKIKETNGWVFIFFWYISLATYTLSRLGLWMFPITYRYFSRTVAMGTNTLDSGSLKFVYQQVEVSVSQGWLNVPWKKRDVEMERFRTWSELWGCNSLFLWACPWLPLGLGWLTCGRGLAWRRPCAPFRPKVLSIMCRL